MNTPQIDAFLNEVACDLQDLKSKLRVDPRLTREQLEDTDRLIDEVACLMVPADLLAEGQKRLENWQAYVARLITSLRS